MDKVGLISLWLREKIPELKSSATRGATSKLAETEQSKNKSGNCYGVVVEGDGGRVSQNDCEMRLIRYVMYYR